MSMVGLTCSMAYTTVDDVATLVAMLGNGALLSKVVCIPPHPSPPPLQVMKWDGQLYIDPMLPFGLRSAPKIFNVVADAWHLHRTQIQFIRHYLDDYIIIAPPSSNQGVHDLQLLLRECTRLGVPVVAHKTCGPATCLTFLGIEIDTEDGELRLPAKRLHRLQTLCQEWGDRKACSREELESLVALLNHAVRSGRSR